MLSINWYTKETINIQDAPSKTIQMLDEIQENLFNQAKTFMDKHTTKVSTWNEFKRDINNGFVVCGWDGTEETEMKIKQETKATIRCLPFEQNIQNSKCIYTNNSAKYIAVFSKAY